MPLSELLPSVHALPRSEKFRLMQELLAELALEERGAEEETTAAATGSDRREAVHRIDALRQRLYATYGEMEDSVALVRTDRAR